MDSQLETGYDDDTIYSYSYNSTNEEKMFGSMTAPPTPVPVTITSLQVPRKTGTETETLAKDDRPSISVKACKDIKVIFVHDLSGSMAPNVHTMVTGTNEFIQDLQARYAEPCEYSAHFMLITFAGDNITVGTWRNVKELTLYTAQNFSCHGTTPLWDACNIGLNKIASDCADCTAVMYVFTDGDDNNSNKASLKMIRSKVAELDATKHTMMFIGSDPLSSEKNAKGIGLDRNRSLNHSAESTPSAMRACTNSIARCVTGNTQTPEFNEGDIAMAEGDGR